jgi:hypothetical protein
MLTQILVRLPILRLHLSSAKCQVAIDWILKIAWSCDELSKATADAAAQWHQILKNAKKEIDPLHLSSDCKAI